MLAHVQCHGDVEEREEGFWIDSGLTVNMPAYLSGLWSHIKCRGAQMEERSINSLDALNSYDQVVIATGARTLDFPECRHLPLQFLKGQTLIMEGNPSYPTSVLGPGYLALFPESPHFEIGATYERKFTSALPDREKAEELLKDPLAQFGKEAKIVGCKAGIRVTVLGSRRPLIQRLDSRTHVFTGLGSRGLLYHAYFAKFLVQGMLSL
jgi:glycine/D-amino acid oxidase-like deaminating enzyme